MAPLRRRFTALVALGALIVLAALPSVAEAHGPVAPIASSYLAKVGQVPAGLSAEVVDGDQRMWLQVQPHETAVVLDYQGAPYLRFSPAGVDVNQNSAMYYLNQTPFAQTPPSNLSSRTPPNWRPVSSDHAYGWHDGRLHALASVALAPGASYVGKWTIPVVVDGQRLAISGGLWHAGDPSIVWFWPIAVVLLCVLAAWRVRRPALDQRTARVLGIVALGAIAVAALGRGLHGRPTLSVLQLVEMAIVLAFVLWGLARLLFQRPRYFSYFVIAFVALWEGAELIPTLLNGFVLIAGPAWLARGASVLALGAGLGLLLLAFRLAESPRSRDSADEREVEDDSAWELA